MSDSPPTPTATPRAARLLALLVASSFFMEYLDGSVLATALPSMARDFQIGPVSLGIGISAYLLTLAVFIPVSGWVADRYGTRSVYTAAIATFTVASVLCALCGGIVAFVAARVLQGMGGAMMVPVGRLVVLRTTEKRHLVNAISLLTWPALAAPILGPPVGGFLVEYASWHWIFLINVPVGLAAIVLAQFFMPNLSSAERRPFDWPGFVLTGGALATLMEGLELTGQPGMSLLVPASLVGAGLLMGFIAVRHAGQTKHPMLDMSAMKIATFRVTQTGGMIFRVCIGSVPFLLPLLFQVGFGLDAFHSGLMMLGVFVGNLAMKPATTAVLRRWGHRTAGVVTAALASLSMLACATFYPSTPTAWMLFWLVLGGLSRSMQFTLLGTLSFSDVPPPRVSGASTFSSVTQQMSSGMGVALGAALLHVVAGASGRVTPSLANFHLVFAVVAGLTLLGVPFLLSLERTAGAEVSGYKEA